MMYTFQDWLDDQIPIHAIPYSNIDNLQLSGKIGKEELSEIHKAQQFAYDESLKNNFTKFKERFLKSLVNSPNPRMLLEQELRETRLEIQEYPREYKRVLEGRKFYSDILVRHYLDVKNRPNSFSFLRVNDHCYIEFQMLKEEWIEVLKKNGTYSNGTNSDSDQLPMEQKVKNAFGFMLAEDPRKHKRILDKDDFNNLICWVTYYFEHDFSIPEISKPIKAVNTNKGNIIFSFKRFFKQEHPERTYPDSLFELYRSIFYPFRKDKIGNFKRQKEPQYYNKLIKKYN